MSESGQPKSVPSRAKGAIARAATLTPEQRSEIARKGAKARAERRTIKATHTGILEFADKKIPCYVLEDGSRILSQRGLNEAFGITHGGSSDRGQKLPRFVGQKSLESFVPSDLMAGIEKPAVFVPPHGGRTVEGYDASVLPAVCRVWLKAREKGALTTERQMATAQQAEIIALGLAHVGIIALVDEATGYQKDRARDALAKILEEFIAKELQPWVQTFPPSFYEQMFRLRGLDFPNGSVKRPQYFGVLTNDLIYKRLAPGVLDELKKNVPRNEDGRPKAKFFQKLTSNTGYPKLKEHLGAVIALMKISKEWNQFVGLLNQHYPKYGDNYSMNIDPGDEDTGRGI